MTSCARAAAALLVSLAWAWPADAADPDLRLVDAARRQDRAAVRTLLNQRADVKAVQPDGAGVLHWAAHWDDVEMAGMLIDAGADVNARNDLGVTPLLVASTNASAPMVDRLLAAGANPNVASVGGESPLLVAARAGNAAVVKALLGKGAQVDAAEPVRGQTALMWAAANRRADGFARSFRAAPVSTRARRSCRASTRPAAATWRTTMCGSW